MYKRDIYLDIDDKMNNYIKSVELDSNSRIWHFHLTVDYQPLNLTGKTVMFMAEKPDKTNVLNDCKIVDAEKGVVEVKLTRQVNAIPGHVKCLLKIIGDEGFVLKTKTFVVDVSKTLSDDAVVSSDEFGALDAALSRVQDIDNRFAQTNAQLSNIESVKTDKSTTQDLQTQVNNLVLGAVGDGNNAEVIQARGDYNTLNDRINSNEKDFYTSDRTGGIRKISPTFSTNGYWSASGVSSHSSYKISNAIFLQKGEYICFEGFGENASVNIIVEVDNSNNFIKKLVASNDFVEKKIYTFSADRDMYISLSSKTDKIGRCLIGNDKLIDVNEKIERLNGNLAVESEIKENYYVNKRGLESSHYKYSIVKTTLKLGDIVNYSCKSDDADVIVGLAIYDAEDNFIEVIEILNKGENSFNYISTRDCIARFSYCKNYTYSLNINNKVRESLNAVEKNIVRIDLNIEDIIKNIDKDYISSFVGGEVICCGDSLTVGYYGKNGSVSIYGKYTYPKFIQYMARGWNVTTKAVGGYTSLQYWNNIAKTTDFSQYDTAIICLGTNEGLTETIDSDTSGDDYLDYADTNTGRYCSIIEKIKSDNPKINIFLCTIFEGSVSTTNSVINKIATKYELDVIDIQSLQGYSDETYHPYDNVHFSKKGYYLMAKMIYDGICEKVANNIDKYNVWKDN